VTRWLVAVIVAALVACGNASPPAPPVDHPPPPRAVPADATVPVIPAATRQLVTAVIDGWDSTAATLRLWSRGAHGWEPVGEPWPAVIGAAGAAWGDGLHGNGPPAGRSGPRKHEGDRRSPAGAFALRAAYGYAATPPAGTTLPYTAVDDRWVCVDDPASRAYASIVARDHTTVDWSSAEVMRRPDAAYTWVVDVAHNPARISGDGSCIFLHVWHGADSTTVGCTAMAEPVLAHLIATLDAKAAPVYVLLPRDEYLAVVGSWGLPPLPGSARLVP
jgi:L,D-peptidoglycan transpeptidase YkuD (ErfK/YbiS/YcfS/YnhG family)